MRALYQKLLENIALGLADAGNTKVFEEVTQDAQFLGVATKIEIFGVRAMSAVAERTGHKSPAIHPPVYRYLKSRIEKKLAESSLS